MKKLIYIIAFCLLFLNGTHVSAASRIQPTPDEPIVIVIDPGHGGENEGTIENGFLEKSMTMITAQAMYEELNLYDNIEVYLTRTEDCDMTLKERAEFAASVHADFLFSIHYNASVKHDLFGSEVWISSANPFNAYGYQFGCTQMETMQEMGLFLRGVKTKKNDRGTDYYGIIREATQLNVPAVIIEHCHVDEERDYPFCDSEEELVAFGKADAISVAKYFGLKSELLNIDYTSYSAEKLKSADANHTVSSTEWDDTPPEICKIETLNGPDEKGMITLQISAADYDSPLIYYDYSYDNGETYSPLQIWPGSNVLKGTYTDTFQFTLQVPYDTIPYLTVRAYNQFDTFTVSNQLVLPLTKSPESIAEENKKPEELSEEDAESAKQKTKHFFHIPSQLNNAVKDVDLIDFLLISMIIVVLLFISLLIAKCITASRLRKRRRRQAKKTLGNTTRQTHR
ncbi:MAG: N-acetylmuramoyl-L-alanine amidase [Acetatifactor sp.]|nr:N-acetylmuramoyl-L-alanine amidase [Acetatifactor sp.]